jgi:hypothetical protein
MDVLREGDALGYCKGSSEHREGLWRQAERLGENPAYCLPIFELCRAVHFGAREGGKRFDVAGFRDCWQALVEGHQGRRAVSGCLLRLLDGGDESSDNVPLHVWSRAKAGEPFDRLRHRDPRDQVRDPRPFTECFRNLDALAVEEVGRLEEWERQWSYDLPELSESMFGVAGPARSLVLDTNFFVDLLDELMPDGSLLAMPCQAGRPASKLGGASRAFAEALRSRGASGKLIVPAAVLVESYGIVHVKGVRRLTNAADVMARIQNQGSDWPLWDVFAFPALSFEVFEAFLYLHEEMACAELPRDEWPDFTDAIVLAHALVERCPVVSAEWTEKQDWKQVKRLFPWLVPR